MRYRGGKAKSFHHVINLIPPHTVYIEPFLGVGSVMRAKLSSRVEVGIDLDENVLAASELRMRGATLLCTDGISYLERYPFEGHEIVYCDPPYFPSTRRRKQVYRFDATEADHERMLSIVTRMKAKVLLSGYDNDVYRRRLTDWNVHRFLSKAHDGVREECIWYNYGTPNVLHDYRYLGADFRERQTIKRRLSRLQRRIESLPELEQAFIRQWLLSKEGGYAA
jgi:site-specific DNA-adenine methylase